jgi:hypothetical protein
MPLPAGFPIGLGDITDLYIWKLALLRIGNTNLPTAETDTTPEAIACSTLYVHALNNVLEEGEWPFATKRADLVEKLETRVGWDFVYEYPGDCVRFLGGTDYTGKFIALENQDTFFIEGALDGSGLVIVSNTELLNGLYISNNMDIVVWPAMFVDAVAMKLAAELALAIKKDPKLAELLNAKYEQIVAGALAAQFEQSNPGVEPESSIINARR